jgi:hypothetical protein
LLIDNGSFQYAERGRYLSDISFAEAQSESQTQNYTDAIRALLISAQHSPQPVYKHQFASLRGENKQLSEEINLFFPFRLIELVDEEKEERK